MKPLPPETVVKLIDLRQLAQPQERVRLVRRLREKLDPWALVCVLLPTLLAAAYFGLIASDRYAAEMRYVVRSPQTQVANQLGGLLQSTGYTSGGDSAHAINAYIVSRDALHDLIEDVDIRAIYGSPRADLFSRFPRPFGRSTTEALFAYFETMVSAKVDRTTGITTVEVQAFSPEDAKRIADALVRRAEALSNRLTRRLRDDLVRTAEEEVARARARSLTALAALTDFRNREQTVDPTRYSAALVETIARLSLELAQMRAQQEELRRASPQSPQIAALANRIRAFEEQIASERLTLAGSADSMAPRIAEYERLMLEREFSDRLLAAAVNSLENARQDAQRQQIYVELVVTPRVPDYPAYPYRLLAVLAVFAVAVLAYVVLSTLVRNVRRHV
jgi:capsular polysaccharide transport system permease protein